MLCNNTAAAHRALRFTKVFMYVSHVGPPATLGNKSENYCQPHVPGGMCGLAKLANLLQVPRPGSGGPGLVQTCLQAQHLLHSAHRQRFPPSSPPATVRLGPQGRSGPGTREESPAWKQA